MSFVGPLRRGPVLGWCLFAVTLAGLGWGLYVKLPPQPRWQLRGAIAAVGLSPDGKTFRTETERVEDLPRSTRSPSSLFWWPQGGPVQFWDVETGREVSALFGESGPRWHFVFSEDGKRLVAVTATEADDIDKELHCIDLETGHAARTTIAYRARPSNVWFAPGGQLLLIKDTGPGDAPTHDLYLYDAHSLRLLMNATARNHWPTWHWSLDGEGLLIYTTDEQGNALLRRIGPAGETRVHLDEAGDWLALAPDGKTLATAPPGSAERATVESILLWDVPTGRRRGIVPVHAFDVQERDDHSDVFHDSHTLLVKRRLPARGDVTGAWDIETGKWLGEVQFAEPLLQIQRLPEQKAFVIRGETVLPADGRAAAHLEWHGVRPFGKQWERDWPGSRLHGVYGLAVPHRVLVTFSTPCGLIIERTEILDAATGDTVAFIEASPEAHIQWITRGRFVAFRIAHLDPGERSPFWDFVEQHILARLWPARRRDDTPPVTTCVVDAVSGEVLARFDHSDGDLSDLSADGRLLFLYREAGPDGEAAATCYDIPPGKAWGWIIGTPLALGVLSLSLRSGYRRLRLALERHRSSRAANPGRSGVADGA
jgi:hypothetical protein